MVEHVEVQHADGPSKAAVLRAWRTMPVADRGEGIYLYDTDGKRYIDGASGSSVAVNLRARRQVDPGRDVRADGEGVLRRPPRVRATSRSSGSETWSRSARRARCATTAARGSHARGTDAVDDAMRLTRQYFITQGKRSKTLFISRWNSFHGNNLAVTGMHGATPRRRMYAGLNINMPHIPPAYCYRCPFEMTRDTCNLKCARALETEIRQQGEENVAAFVAEPVVGTALGAVPAPDGYFQVIREICDKYDVLLIVDEVMSAWGRIGHWFGIEAWGVTPDIIATAKGLTGAYATLAATIGREESGRRSRKRGQPTRRATPWTSTRSPVRVPSRPSRTPRSTTFSATAARRVRTCSSGSRAQGLRHRRRRPRQGALLRYRVRA